MLRKLVMIGVVFLFVVALGTACTGDEDSKGPYIGNTETNKYHVSSCSYLPDSNHRVSLENCGAASSGGYSPCGHCEPCGGKSLTAP